MWYFNETKLLLENLTSSGQEYFIIKKTGSIVETFHVLLYCNNCGNKNTLAFFTSEEEAEKQLRIIARNLKAINLEPEQMAIPYYVPNYAPIISYLA